MRTIPAPVRYAVARWGERWPEADLDGLVADPAGGLKLRLLPGLESPSISPTADPPPSGLALDRSCGLYVADTSGNRIIRAGLDCPGELVLPGDQGFPGLSVIQSPAGLAWGAHHWLFAGCGDGKVLVLSTPELEVRDEWPGFGQPAYLACHRDRVLVSDTGARALRRFDWRGRPDDAFNQAVAPPAGPGDPRGVAVATDGTIFVADAAAGGVMVLSWSGVVAGAPIATGIAPRSLAIAGATLFVSDAASGQVLAFAIPGGKALGAVSGFAGPVTALAASDTGLFIKNGPGPAYVRARMGSAYRTSGSVTVGPLDAGKQSCWTRAEVDARVPDRTTVDVAWYTDSTPAPASVTWTVAPSLDFLLDGDRYLWLRATATTRHPGTSPTLYQLGAQTAGDSYLDYLPYLYSHDPDQSGLSALTLNQAQPADFGPGDLNYLRLLYSRTPPQGNETGRLLDLARSQLGGLEHVIDALPRSFDPATAPAEMLTWLASWMAFDLPPRLLDGTHPDEVRRLLLGLAALYRQRATPRGLADFVEVYSGTRPHVLEDFRYRPLWVLGETALGFGTGIPDRDVEGMLVGEAIVGGTGPEDPATIGSALFESTAHRFTVVVPATSGQAVDRSLVMKVVEAEKPAHTGFHLCFAGPRMRVGIQARIGVDALVAAGPDEMTLGGTSVLGAGNVLGGPEMGPASVGTHRHVGIDMVVT
jgi:phage tail-like protein